MPAPPAPDGVDPHDWANPTGLGAVLHAQYRDGEPPWAQHLRPCAPHRTCAARLELLSVAEALRCELLAALAELHQAQTSDHTS